MKKYRIKEYIYQCGSFYEVQKRLFGFLWWYNFEIFDNYRDGFYCDYRDAEHAIIRRRDYPKIKIHDYDK